MAGSSWGLCYSRREMVQCGGRGVGFFCQSCQETTSARDDTPGVLIPLKNLKTNICIHTNTHKLRWKTNRHLKTMPIGPLPLWPAEKTMHEGAFQDRWIHGTQTCQWVLVLLPSASVSWQVLQRPSGAVGQLLCFCKPHYRHFPQQQSSPD